VETEKTAMMNAIMKVSEKIFLIGYSLVIDGYTVSVPGGQEKVSTTKPRLCRTHTYPILCGWLGHRSQKWFGDLFPCINPESFLFCSRIVWWKKLLHKY
jgi:hypothetical protein